ncbi:formylglycine-generating enzyme family protein [Leucothrix pacifica]|uniref:Formylglycine-generating enzyme family protein n=2 Tax=Leucothrix pacifica TaxID=1247513 RepID=A0A317CJL5_9GAMM|nr:formylglycine-generating enzyme family protein [Leucothrix pacifica]
MRPEWQDEKLKWQPVEETEKVGTDEFGLFAEFTVKGVTQRLRYIEPTTFMMGSPENEDGRYNNEDLHQVTLSQGYWLADTACTQELWQTVTGDNPSEFKDDSQNPVVQVSWLDTQRFIQQLKQLTPELLAHLPTEAQWENACRAGTATPFSFDDDISVDRVNYRDTWELEKEGEGFKWGKDAKQKTARIKSYAPNDWGLYEMHGNVFEWCFDEWQENLGNSSVIDPVTARFSSAVAQEKQADKTGQYGGFYDSALLTNAEEVGVQRVLRGGSWYGHGWSCRSAIRYRNDASNRVRFFGFRIAVGL